MRSYLYIYKLMGCASDLPSKLEITIYTRKSEVTGMSKLISLLQIVAINLKKWLEIEN